MGSSTKLQEYYQNGTICWIDYSIFIATLLVSVAIGFYFGFLGKKPNTTQEYLLGGKNMNVMPISLSLIASQVSAVSLLAVPADVYKFGANYIWISVSIIITYFLSYFVHLPVLCKLQRATVFEYFNQRFNHKIRIFSSGVAILGMLLATATTTYIPAIALSQATGVDVRIIIPACFGICIAYTAVGGFKAVIWTDAFQFLVMVTSVIAVTVFGLISVGGFDVVFERAIAGERLDLFHFQFDPTIRDDFWSMIIGATSSWLFMCCLNPSSFQKIVSLGTLAKARKSAFYFAIGSIFFVIVNVFMGIIIYAKYADCDPMSIGKVSRGDEILPYLVMDVARDIPGLPGIFLGGIFSAALSTVSTILNTLAAVIYDDFLFPFMPIRMADRKKNNILKLTVVIAGIVSTTIAIFIEQIGSVVPFSYGVGGVFFGVITGLFHLGMLFPSANYKGALCGGIVSFVTLTWITAVNQWYKLQGIIDTSGKMMSVQACDFNGTITPPTIITDYDQPFVLYRLSFWYTPFLGIIIVILVGVPVSWITKTGNETVHRDLISPVSHFLLAKEEHNTDACTVNDLQSC